MPRTVEGALVLVKNFFCSKVLNADQNSQINFKNVRLEVQQFHQDKAFKSYQYCDVSFKVLATVLIVSLYLKIKLIEFTSFKNFGIMIKNI